MADRIINIKQLASLRNPSKIRTNSLVTDVFESSKGILEIRNVRSGDYGAICDGSKPLKPFFEMFDDITVKKLKQKGISTNIVGDAPCYLKSKANTPLSTSEVHDCSVAYFYNEQNQTHFLFHIHPSMGESSIQNSIQSFMPEGFQKATIVPGDNYWTAVHKKTLPKIFKIIRQINPETKIDVFHSSSRLPEIVGYNGSVYEIRNKRHIMHYSIGQASFNISDIENVNTLNEISRAKDEFTLKLLHGAVNLEDYDPEVKKVLHKLIDEKIAKLSNSN